MELLERYLAAARHFQPRSQQDDILKEVSTNHLEQPRNASEQAAILKQAVALPCFALAPAAGVLYHAWQCARVFRRLMRSPHQPLPSGVS